jgi:hypothetical protein
VPVITRVKVRDIDAATARRTHQYLKPGGLLPFADDLWNCVRGRFIEIETSSCRPCHDCVVRKEWRLSDKSFQEVVARFPLLKNLDELVVCEALLEID